MERSSPEHPTDEQIERLITAWKKGGKGTLRKALDEMYPPKEPAETEEQTVQSPDRGEQGKARVEYPTEAQIDEMWGALEKGDDEEILAVLRKRRQEREEAEAPKE